MGPDEDLAAEAARWQAMEAKGREIVYRDADTAPRISGNTFIDDATIATADFRFGKDALAGFANAARKLKAAESAVAEARAEYAEAVKRLSEEAVR